MGTILHMALRSRKRNLQESFLTVLNLYAKIAGMKKTPQKKRLPQIAIPLEAAVLKRLRSVAKAEDRSLAAFVRRLIDAALAFRKTEERIG